MGRVILDVVDALRDLLEPPFDDERSVNGVLIDRTCSQPNADTVANTIYAWEAARAEVPIGTGEVRQNFAVTLLYVVDNVGEAAGERDRSVSEALDAKTDEYMKLIRLHAHVPPWDSGNVQATSDADFVRQFEVRGVAIRVTGYRLVTE